MACITTIITTGLQAPPASQDLRYPPGLPALCIFSIRRAALSHLPLPLMTVFCSFPYIPLPNNLTAQYITVLFHFGTPSTVIPSRNIRSASFFVRSALSYIQSWIMAALAYLPSGGRSVQKICGTLARSVMLLSRYSCPNEASGLRPLFLGEQPGQ